ncbi:hypothetical protein AVEN_165183-1 [Araneus ventricosus]|uniref:Uncharacterized protein n=1 Tax=Araneus ventricosus TaxID=182803 RepID=A0A4Y2B8G4_ARAVE|nr:hypothetical protein AVEN_165183-1 [Araneus ventricosus]
MATSKTRAGRSRNKIVLKTIYFIIQGFFILLKSLCHGQRRALTAAPSRFILTPPMQARRAEGNVVGNVASNLGPSSSNIIRPSSSNIIRPSAAHIIRPSAAHIIRPSAANIIRPSAARVRGQETGERVPRRDILIVLRSRTIYRNQSNENADELPEHEPPRNVSSSSGSGSNSNSGSDD